jgi:16S rRNA G527 N7-methylase RsmG
MDPVRISALLEPFLDQGCPTSCGFRAPQLDQISTYIDLLLRWNARINLTAIRDPEQIVTRHFGESLFLARHLFPSITHHQPPATDHPPAGVLDLGSGAGFPALPVKIWAPEIHLTLIESNHKKAAFLREVVRSLTLTNVDVIAGRAETVLARLAPIPAGLTQKPSPMESPNRADSRATSASYTANPFPPADIVTFRAVEKFDQILPLAASFLAPQGRLALLIGAAQLPKLKALPAMKWATIGVPKSHARLLAIGIYQQSGYSNQTIV